MDILGEKMTPTTVTISHDLSISDALRRMFYHGVRHLPVTDGERILGIVSQHDLHGMEGLPDVEPETLDVGAAVMPDILTFTPDTPILEVLQAMIRERRDAVLVVEGLTPVGIYTTIDALQGYEELLTWMLQNVAPDRGVDTKTARTKS